jgi:hypothetical protein
MVISHFRLIKSTNFKSLKVSIAGENKAKWDSSIVHRDVN